MKIETDEYYDEVVELEPREALRIVAPQGYFKVMLTQEGHLEINFAGITACQAIAVLPKVSNVVELKPIPL